MLLVLTDDGLHRVKAREFGHGFAIEKTPLDVIRALLSAHGLHIVSEAEKRVLSDVVRIVADWIDAGDDQDPDVSMQEIETVACVQVATELARRAAKEQP